MTPGADTSTGGPAAVSDRPGAQDLLAGTGPFATNLPSFVPRQAQQQMAALVEAALSESATLVVEAGTGTGKTFAYLVPVVQSGAKVLLSTGTKTLQKQLFERDLPLVLQVLGPPRRTALLKGRSNYLCPHRLELALETIGLFDQQSRAQLSGVYHWWRAGGSGDLADYGTLSEQSPIWGRVTSTVDNCLGTECPQVDACPLLEARRRAMQADIIVVNHHLLFADRVLKDDGVGELLPEVEAIVVDEAHQLRDVATQFFGVRISSRQLSDLCRDSIHAMQVDAADDLVLGEAADALAGAVVQLSGCLGAGGGRIPWRQWCRDSGGQAAAQRMLLALEQVEQRLQVAAPRSRDLERCAERAAAVLAGLRGLLDEDPGVEQGPSVRWWETTTRGFVLHSTPVSVAEPVSQAMAEYEAAWVLTSATLTVAGGFDAFLADLGLPRGCRTAQLESPFDYPRQALAYLPPGMPEPRDAAYTEVLLAHVMPLIEASDGGAFLLFTSHRALRIAAAWLRAHTDRPLLVQGELSREAMVEGFRASPNGLLLGSSSFWQGIDVAGDQLRLVVIDKLPFASPDDPVTEARVEALRQGGGNPFRELQIPQAVVALKQGVGRLIRTTADRGLLVLGDPRLNSKAYGKVFLASLPPFPRTSDPDRALAFAHALASPPESVALA